MQVKPRPRHKPKPTIAELTPTEQLDRQSHAHIERLSTYYRQIGLLDLITPSSPKAIRCSDGRTFASIGKAAQAFGVRREKIIRLMDSGGEYKGITLARQP
jgi:hypothetical protein